MSNDHIRRELLTELMAKAPYQPATNYWRSIELEHVIRYGFPAGFGLDLGCGDGHLMDIILHHAGDRKLVGIDLDESETALAKTRNLYLEVITAPGDHLPFPDQHFDFVFSNSVLEHIAPIDETLKEVSRVLKAGARFLFTVPGPDFHRSLRPTKPEDDDYFREVDARCAHLRYWSAEEWTDHLQGANISLVHQHGYLTEKQVQRWDLIARWTSGILYRLVKRKKQPIQLQRQLGIRSQRVRLPGPVASLAASFLDKSLPDVSDRYGCLLIEGRKN